MCSLASGPPRGHHSAYPQRFVELRLERLREERLSTQKCLLICTQFSELIYQFQPLPAEDLARGSNTPKNITSRGIQECKDSMDQTTAKLERHMQGILDRIMSISSAAMTQEDMADLARLREEWITSRKCRDICSAANRNLQENISVIDNHATGDEAVQFLVSNSLKTIHGKNRGYGDLIKQVGGHLSDESIQKVSGDFLQMCLQKSGHSSSLSRGATPSGSHDTGEGGTKWHPQYGNGRTLDSSANSNFAATQKLQEGAHPDRSQKHFCVIFVWLILAVEKNFEDACLAGIGRLQRNIKLQVPPLTPPSFIKFCAWLMTKSSQIGETPERLAKFLYWILVCCSGNWACSKVHLSYKMELQPLAIQAGVYPQQDPWTEYQLEPGKYDRIQQLINHNKVLIRYAKDKIRKCNLLDRPRYISAESEAKSKSKSKYEPDTSFWHDDAEYPRVVVEVAYSQKRKRLEQLAENYLLNSDASVQVVVRLDIGYAADPGGPHAS
ncbi:hypothetical protein IQ07DRAFT_627154 [Pyrenochaeta sp. DS3sAY3a]|nr:hypothetical protein IQ07DRAFT_627154 [Pyrenochaeta sp. DS3sAY3a]